MTWVLDLDGVIWRGNAPIDGSADAIATLQQKQIPVRYVTNNASISDAEIVQKMAGMGIAADERDVLSTRALLFELLGGNSTVLCATKRGLADAVAEAGNTVWHVGNVTSAPSVDFVIIGQSADLNYMQLSFAAQAVLNGAKLLAPNRDPLYPDESGMVLGSGSLVATIEFATGVQATVVGKPEQAMVDYVKTHAPNATLVVGDQLSSDGELARKADIPFAYVESGVGEVRNQNLSTPVAHRAKDLAQLVNNLT